jgi:hypothetical protein
MLRSLLQPESELLKLCHSREWQKVKLRCTNSPKEAKPTSSAYRGIANTALVVAIRNNAPLDVVAALIDANTDQLMKVRHHRHGNALHEAIKQRSAIDVVLFLIHKIIKLERESRWLSSGELKPMKLEFGPASVAPHVERKGGDMSLPSRVHTHCTLFNQTDHFRRTPLHYLVERFSKETSGNSSFINAVQILVHAFPPAVGKADTDDLTPLAICLITPKNTSQLQEMEVEMKVFSLVKIMIQAFPSAATPSINSAQANVRSGIDMLYNHEATGGVRGQRSVLVTNARDVLMNTVDGNVSHNLLSHALMHGRHLSTIELLIGASQTSNPSWHTGHIHDWDEFETETEAPKRENESYMAIVSKDFEVPLHIAVTMRASPDVVAHVVQSEPDAASIPDRCGLTPICWTWIRFVIDEIKRADRESTTENAIVAQPTAVKKSKRRFLPNAYVEFNEKLTSDIASSVTEFMNETDMRRLHHIRDMNNNIERRSLWSKLSNLLPSAAKAFAYNDKTSMNMLGRLDTITQWSPVHAASYISCPRAVLFAALYNCPSQSWKQVDELGNLPIHYAAARQGYSKSLPIGVTFSPHELKERSSVFDLVPLYPDCTKVVNCSGQLPIHIAIDKDKEARMSNSIFNQKEKKRLKRSETKDSIADSPLLFLARADTESLEIRDGKTNLYPFIQAAAGDGASLDIIYCLLIKNPSLVKAFTTE